MEEQRLARDRDFENLSPPHATSTILYYYKDVKSDD